MPLDEIKQAQFDELHMQIHEAIHADHDARWMQTVGGFSGHRMPEQGMFVKTGPHGTSMRGSIGWVAQVRLKQGQFGSDNYILCHAGKGGWLMQHSNNVFYPLTPAEVEQVRPYFADCLPENESFPTGITLGSDETRAIGFLIDPPERLETRGGEGVGMRITTIGADGSKTLTETVFF
ncbi:hypothetical protein [Pseudomonas viridiflava]|uniref:hypothetical protein n=1 Tax=Pseudomonas viridiflava TaxID=33069 RepID=UPI000F01FA3C|nr:hypothetical protein [Pseudomonas viridiflava]